MKVIAFLEEPIISGGGFNQALNATLQMAQLCEGRFEFEVVTTHRDNVGFLRNLGVEAILYRLTFFERALSATLRMACLRGLCGHGRLLIGLEKRLISRGCDLVYFTSPSVKSILLKRLNYIATLWDLCHRDSPEFPEVRNYAELFMRDAKFRTMLAGAYAVIVDSELLASKAARRYGIDQERMLPMPFTSAPFLAEKHAHKTEIVLSEYGINSGYYFYPAQFWAHKNHIRILQALAMLKDRGIVRQAVFSGRDAGNRAYVEATASKLGLTGQVTTLGFVPAEHMRGLYEGCAAVVVPTYFGPTNIPPLEAWLLKRPLVYSRACAEQAGDAALVVDPDDHEALANAMERVLDPTVAADLVERGSRRLEEIAADRAVAEQRMFGCLEEFSQRRECWA